MNLLRKFAVVAGFILVTVSNRSVASTVTTVYPFTGGSDGAHPFGTLVLGSDSNFYGTAYQGGINNSGAVFQISLSGAFTPLYDFTGGADGATPVAGLVQGANGLFYGTTFGGGTLGQGAVYSINAQGQLTPLYSFTGLTDGAQPYGGLTQGVDSNFYGTTYSSGLYGAGTIFRISPQGTLTTIVEFNNVNGASPLSPLVMGPDANFYGTTSAGGLNGSGTVFKVTTGGILTTLRNFGNGHDGAQPFAGLVLGSDTNFYGTTSGGGSGLAGTVFKISAQGTFTTLFNFGNGNTGGAPIGGLVQGIDGNFFGTTAGGGGKGAGTVFQITPAGKLTTLYTFNGGADGAVPRGTLAAATVSNFYGTTSAAGQFGGGTIFDFIPPCNFSVTPTHITFSATANSGSFTIGAASINCTWTAVTSAAWINVTSASGGAGSGTVAYAVAANTNATGRTGTISAGGQTFAITQQAQVLGSFLQGTYTGLLTPEGAPANANSGEIIVVLSKTGSFTATVTIGGVASKFKGVFDAAGDATNTVVRSKLSPLQISLQLLPVTNSTDQMTGTVSDGEFTNDVLADLAVYSKVNLSPDVGLYTMVFEPADGTDPTVPQGYGYGALTLTSLGAGKLAGELADGIKISVAAPISGYGTWPLYEVLYNKLGSCVGTLTISSSNTVSGTMNWFRPPIATSAYYPTGFVTTVNITGAIYVSPAGGPTISGVKTLTLSDGNLSSNIVQTISIDGLGHVKVTTPGPDKLAMKITTTTGEFSGSFIHPATGKSVKFSGVVLPGNSTGAGFFLGTSESGSVDYEPAP